MDEVGCWLFGFVVGIFVGAAWVACNDDVVVVNKIGGHNTVKWDSTLYELTPVEIKAKSVEGH